jgi:magnesium chelatase family protein
VAATIKNSGFYFPTTRITANLAPANVRKKGAAFDLPIAPGVLAATAQIRDKSFDQTLDLLTHSLYVCCVDSLMSKLPLWEKY